MERERIENGYREHAARAQLHRWYQLYERPEGGIDNALDLLDENVTVRSGLGEARGHAAYAERVGALPATWRNAHFVESSEVRFAADGTIALDARVTYLNEGMSPDGAVRRAELDYATTLRPADAGLLPRFTAIDIGQRSEGTADAFRDAYPENRVRSLVHYWLALIEDPARDPEPVREILADDVELGFSSGAIRDFAGFRAWLAGPASGVAASTHVIENLRIETPEADRWTVSMELDWSGLLPDGTELGARTAHRWTVVDDVTERFARIESVAVEVLEPFAPVSR